MARWVFAGWALVMMLAFPTMATAKGLWPSAARISGPGVSQVLELTGGTVGHRALLDFAGQTGFFQAVRSENTRHPWPDRPQGNLGPRYTIVYVITRWQQREHSVQRIHIRQALYPYAQRGAVTYTRPGQRMFGSVTRGGWFRGGEPLKQTLIRNGLRASASGASSSSRDLVLLGGAVAFLCAGAAALVATLRKKHLSIARRRSRHARLRPTRARR